jgi:hypothetical protein
MTFRIIAISAVAGLGFAQAQAAPVAAIVGTWQGTSICVDHVKDPACRDEIVIYDVDSLSTPRGTVNMRADKVVNGVREFMGAMQFAYDAGTKSWSSELTTPRFHGLWAFTIEGNAMNGSLLELPGRRQVRRVSVKRSTPP